MRNLPSKCLLPDLKEDCGELFPQLSLSLTFIGDPDESLAVYRRLIVTLVDRAIREYDNARSAILAQLEEMQRSPEEMIEQGRRLYMFGFTEAIENCLVATRRLMRVLDRLKSLPSSDVNRGIRRYIESQSKEIVGARDFIEHSAEICAGGKLPDNGSLFARLSPNEEGVEVGGFTVTFANLAGTLRRFHEIAQTMIDVRRTSSD